MSGQNSVPRFSSFKAKPRPRRHKDQPSHDSHLVVRSERDRRKGNEESNTGQLNSHVQTKTQKLEASALAATDTRSMSHVNDIYFFDKGGDSDNIRYGSMHRYSIPSYRRSGMGNVLGAASGTRIDRTTSTEKGVVLSDGREEGSARAGGLSSVKAMPQRELVVRSSTPISDDARSYELRQDFLALDETKSHKRRRIDGGGGKCASSSEDDTHYRSFEGQAKACPDPNLQDFNGQATFDDLQMEHAQRTYELDTAVRQDATNGRAWLDLLAHQGSSSYFNRLNNRPTAAELTSIVELKIHLYRKALQSVKDTELVDQLSAGLMREGRKVWDSSKRAREWESLLAKRQGSGLLWIQYLDDVQTEATEGYFDTVSAAYKRCMQRLRSLQSTKASEGRETHLLVTYIVLRYTTWLRQVGYSELAFGIWQALLELNLLSPDFQSLDFAGIMHRLEEFWESEQPRIGDEEAKGWAHSGDSTVPSQNANLKCVSADANAPWVERERSEMTRAAVPARTSNSDDDKDPYRVVLFSDLKDVMILIPSQYHLILINAFLMFCQLPTTVEGVERTWMLDGFIRDQSLPLFDVQSGIDGKPLTGIETAKSALAIPLPYTVANDQSLFAWPGSIFSAMSSQTLQPASGLPHVSWIICVLKLLVLCGKGGDELAETYLVLQATCSNHTALKAAKALLKSQPKNLRLYNAYATLAFHDNCPHTARSVIQNALRLLKSDETIILLRTQMWQSVLSGDFDQGLLDFLACSNSINGLQDSHSDQDDSQQLERRVFLVKQFLLGQRDHLASSGAYRLATACMEVLILLAYLCGGLNITPMQESFALNVARLSELLASVSIHHEALHQLRAQLLYLRMQRKPMVPPKSMRDMLLESVTLFPNNSVVLSAYTLNESHIMLHDRIRTAALDLANRPPSTAAPDSVTKWYPESVMPHVNKIHTEMHRGGMPGPNVNATRAAFEHAVETDACKHSPLIWQWYLRWEHQDGAVAKAKSVFYRAIQMCPWSKELFLSGADVVGSVAGANELQGLYNMMNDRGLRVLADYRAQ